MILLNKFLYCNIRRIAVLFSLYKVNINTGPTEFVYISSHHGQTIQFKSARYPYIIDAQRRKLISLNYEKKNIRLDLGLNNGYYSYIRINMIYHFHYDDDDIKMVVSNWAEIEEFEDNAIYEL